MISFLNPVDALKWLSVMDKSIDVLMGNTPVARRAPRERDSLSRPQLRAEHGVSMLVTIYGTATRIHFFSIRRDNRWRVAQYGRPGSQAQ